MGRDCKVIRKSRELFQFESSYECNKAYYALKAELRKHRMSVDDVNSFFRKMYGFDYDSGGYVFGFNDWTDKISEKDVSMRTLGETINTIVLNIEKPEEKEDPVTLDDLCEFLHDELKESINSFIKYNKNFNKDLLADVSLVFQIEGRKMHKPIVIKEVKDE